MDKIQNIVTHVLSSLNFVDAYNTVTGSFVALAACILGKHWFLFIGFLVLNVFDWFTGWLISKILNRETSEAGWKGVLKKLGYWVMIALAFLLSALFIDLGEVLDMDLGITIILGYFVLASLIVNEVRSIIENFVEAGFNVPSVLVKGLAVADKMINKTDQEEYDEANDLIK